MRVNFRHVWTCSFYLSLLLFSCEIDAKKNKADIAKTVIKKTNSKDAESPPREGKLFSLFNVVHFKNDACSSQATVAGWRRNGTCYTKSECTQKGGLSSGGCAAGFGVCCLFLVTNSSSTIKQNCTYVQNPGYPAVYSATSAVQYTVAKTSSDVCYLRLDFEIFTIMGVGGTADFNSGNPAATPAIPAIINTCKDTFVVTTQSGQTIPQICGENSLQHIFVDMGNGASDTATLAFTFNTGTTTTTSTTSATSRTWDIKVTQYACGDINAPPEGCLQYVTGLTGTFTTFNFNAVADNSLPNQQYSYCIRQEDGFCCVQYQVCPGVTNAFTLSGLGPATATAMFDSICVFASNDYIGIADSASVCNQGNGNVGYRSRYCSAIFNDVQGTKTNAPICDCTTPFSIEVFTNNLADTIATDPSKGACLQWTQVPCTG